MALTIHRCADALLKSSRPGCRDRIRYSGLYVGGAPRRDVAVGGVLTAGQFVGCADFVSRAARGMQKVRSGLLIRPAGIDGTIEAQQRLIRGRDLTAIDGNVHEYH
jgi:hypothetical protein